MRHYRFKLVFLFLAMLLAAADTPLAKPSG